MKPINIKHLTPKTATHPGEYLLDELNERKLKQNDLAMEMEVPKSTINEIIKGKKSINTDIALKLEKVLHIPAKFWLTAQTNYDIDLHKISEKYKEYAQNLEIWNVIKSYITMSFFKKNGVVTDDLKQNIANIFKVFNVSNLEDFIRRFSEFKAQKYRTSSNSKVDENSLVSWVNLVKYRAKNKYVAHFDHRNQFEVFNAIKSIVFANAPTILKDTEDALSSFGIKFLVIENPQKCAVDGVSFWSEGQPAIALSLRNKTIDSFAFTLFHELAHIYLHLINNNEKEYINLEEKELYEEKEADNLASEMLIPNQLWNRIKQSNFHNEEYVLHLSKLYNIHPAIFQGRYSKESNNYKIKKIDGKLKISV